MLQLYAILIVGLAHAAESGLVIDSVFAGRLLGWPSVILACGPPLIVLAWFAAITSLCVRRIKQRGGRRYVDLADRSLIITQWSLILVHAAAVLGFGWMRTTQGFFGGDVILIDVLLASAPPLLGMTAAWAIQYPVSKRVREALVLRSIDEGHLPPAVPSLGAYVLLQWRINILFMLVPILMIVGANDLIDVALRTSSAPAIDPLAREILSLMALVAVFILAPALAPAALGLKPLPAGPQREALLDVCRAHLVRVRDVMLWNTGRMMINGAVMGLVGRLRYVILTDALLEVMPGESVVAVMAHEVGHVRRRHLPWLAACLLATITVGSVLIELAIRAGERAGWIHDVWQDGWAQTGLAGLLLTAAFLVFGWISRRFERQADTFGAQHLSGLRARRDADTSAVIADQAARTMADALEDVAQLNGIDPDRSSWRHGSIRWRQRYLATLPGKPLRGLAIDRQVRLIKAVAAIVLLAALILLLNDSGLL